MRQMGIEAIYAKPKTSEPNPEHRIYPYLLRELDISVPQQSCARDEGTDPSQSACRSRLQTTVCGLGQKPRS
jgi:hypothetical protein